MVDLNEKILQFRKKLKLTQKEFADRIGYSRTYLSDIEVGKTHASMRFVNSVTKEFGITYQELKGNELGEWIDNVSLWAVEDGQFPLLFVYGFFSTELAIGEDELNEFFKEKPDFIEHVMVNAKEINSVSELVQAITGENCKAGDAYKAFSKFCQNQDDLLYICINSISKSRIRSKGAVLQRLLDVARDSPGLALIVLDKASFVEELPDELYYRTQTMHVGLDYHL